MRWPAANCRMTKQSTKGERHEHQRHGQQQTKMYQGGVGTGGEQKGAYLQTRCSPTEVLVIENHWPFANGTPFANGIAACGQQPRRAGWERLSAFKLARGLLIYISATRWNQSGLSTNILHTPYDRHRRFNTKTTRLPFPRQWCKRLKPLPLSVHDIYVAQARPRIACNRATSRIPKAVARCCAPLVFAHAPQTAVLHSLASAEARPFLCVKLTLSSSNFSQRPG